MNINEDLLLGFAAALGGGLLIGIERERRKGAGRHRAIAGVRSFALVALAGAAANVTGQPLLIAAGAFLISALAVVAYRRDQTRDPGITTEIALLVTYLLGGLAIEHPIVSAGGAVVVTVLLTGRQALREFSVDTLSETELRDGLVFAASALILLPLMPNEPVAWALGTNPRRLWGLVVLFLALQAAGYMALRAAGARLGLALSGLASGFISSTGTIAALGARARENPALGPSCVAGALFSTVGTIVLLGIVVLTICPAALPHLAPSLTAALLASVAGAGFSFWRQRHTEAPSLTHGRAFSLGYALGFAALLTGVTAAVSLASTYLGETAAATATAIAGAFDVHAATASTLSLAMAGKLVITGVRTPILIAVSTNTVSKVVAAFAAGGRRYGSEVSLGLALVVAAAWLPILIFDGSAGTR
ncbi:MAG: MgtC/SapB family protein [Pseudomonadota bacterium]